eukprot:TRINITY_DN8457_c0_g1_i2.p1 TRINITY_DN8457_c0_g1~~TRINITY_DN8457_c0_g1_i2.p1  ORF type:complete len:746 (-),score=240.79 TRINITY_DN8457_c0_g1_i2:172-2409(-)
MDEREERELRQNSKNKGSHIYTQTKTSLLFQGITDNKDKKNKKSTYKRDSEEEDSDSERERESVKEKIQRLKNERKISDNTAFNKSSHTIKEPIKKETGLNRSQSSDRIYELPDEEEEEEEEKSEKKKGWLERRKEKKELKKRLKEKRDRLKENKMMEEENNSKNLFKTHVKLRKIIRSSHFANLYIQSYDEKDREKIHWMITVWGEIEYASEFMNREEDLIGDFEEDLKDSRKRSGSKKKLERNSNDFMFSSEDDSSTIDDMTLYNFQQTLHDIYRFYLSNNPYKLLSNSLQKKLDENFKNSISAYKAINFQIFEETQKEIESDLKNKVEKFYDNYLEALSFQKQSNKVATTVNDLFTTDLNGYFFLRAGSIPRILDWILWNKYEVPKSEIIAFFLSYKPFYQSTDLLNLMIERYKNPKLLPFGEQMISITNTKRLISEYVKLWVTMDKNEFMNSKVLLTNLLSFADHLAENELNLLLIKLKNKKTAIVLNKNEVNFTINPKINILENMGEQMLCDTLTLLEVESFVSIEPIEYVNWKGKNKEINSPNLAKSAERFNQVSFWLVKQINSVEDKSSATIIEILIKTSRILKLNNNFNCLMQIVSAFSNGDLMCTKKSRPKMWGMVSPKLLQELQEIEDFMLPIGNFKNYRVLFNKSITQKIPIVPYLPVHLRDLIYINDGNPDKLEDDLLPKNYVSQDNLDIINFEKMQLIGKEISQLLIIRDMLHTLKYDFNSNLVSLVRNVSY